MNRLGVLIEPRTDRGPGAGSTYALVPKWRSRLRSGSGDMRAGRRSACIRTPAVEQVLGRCGMRTQSRHERARSYRCRESNCVAHCAPLCQVVRVTLGRIPYRILNGASKGAPRSICASRNTALAPVAPGVTTRHGSPAPSAADRDTRCAAAEFAPAFAVDLRSPWVMRRESATSRDGRVHWRCAPHLAEGIVRRSAGVQQASAYPFRLA